VLVDVDADAAPSAGVEAVWPVPGRVGVVVPEPVAVCVAVKTEDVVAVDVEAVDPPVVEVVVVVPSLLTRSVVEKDGGMGGMSSPAMVGGIGGSMSLLDCGVPCVPPCPAGDVPGCVGGVVAVPAGGPACGDAWLAVGITGGGICWTDRSATAAVGAGAGIGVTGAGAGGGSVYLERGAVPNTITTVFPVDSGFMTT
jgi:hypothetical protein